MATTTTPTAINTAAPKKTGLAALEREYTAAKCLFAATKLRLESYCEELFAALDTNRSGRVSAGEFVARLLNASGGLEYDELRARLRAKTAEFQAIDTSGDFNLSLDELTKFVLSHADDRA